MLQTVLYQEATVMLPGLVLLVSTACPLILYIDRIEAFEDSVLKKEKKYYPKIILLCVIKPQLACGL